MQCPVCRTENPETAVACRRCGVLLRTTGERPRRWLWLRILLPAVAGLLVLAGVGLLTSVAFQSLSLKRSDAYAQALDLTRNSPEVQATLGQPVQAGWWVHGETRPPFVARFAHMVIPLVGPRGEGTLYVVANRGASSLVLERVVFVAAGGQKINLTPSPERESLPVHGNGRVYLVPLGEPMPEVLAGLPEYYRRRFGLEVNILPAVYLDAGVEDSARRQAVAEKLIDRMCHAHPELIEDPENVLLGVTNRDMYIGAFRWRFAFNFRESARFGVVSTARMHVRSLFAPENPELVRVRIRKMLTKNIGILFYQLPLSDDPTSVLAAGVNSADDLDLMTEDLIGAEGAWNSWVASGDPCVSITRLGSGKTFWRFHCEDLPPEDPRAEFFENDLRLGLFVQRQADFYIDDVLPLWVVRSYRPQDNVSRAFGIGTNHSYDIFLVGDAATFSYVELIHADGGRTRYRRTSRGSGYADAVFTSDEDSTNPFTRATIRWNGNGWDLRRHDGWTFVFPDGHDARRAQQAALIGIRDSRGHEFHMRRDARGNLLRITSPNGSAIEFEYDSADRVVRATDKHGRSVVYRYDAGGRLAYVGGSAGHIEQYVYDSKNQMREVRNAEGKVLLQNEYDARGNLVRQTLGDSRIFAYRFDADTGGNAGNARFVDPEGYETQFQFGRNGYTQSLPQRAAR